MQKSNNPLNIISNIFLVIGSSVIGAIIGIIVGIGLISIQESSISNSWSLLESPSKFIQIDTNADPQIIAKSVENKLYALECRTKSTCQWIETQETKSFIYYNDGWLRKGPSCQFSRTVSTAKDPPGKVVECVAILWAAGEGYSTDYYALLDDGRVWHWRDSGDAFGSLSLIFISMSICCILGIIIGIAYVNRRKVKKME